MVKHYLHKLSAPFSLRRVLLAAMLLLIGSTASAYDFAVKNADGVTIYYNKLDGGGVEVTSSPSTYSGIVNIPSYILIQEPGMHFGGVPSYSYSVTSIEFGAFRDCTGLTEVTIPNSVTSIPNLAFDGCTGLTEVTIPNSVTSIPNAAFSGCSGLTEVTIPNSVTSIDSHAFDGCSGLTEVTIPNSVTSIGEYAFDGCSGLTEVNFNASNCTEIGRYDYNGFFSAFSGCYNIQKLTIGNNVQTIPSRAFEGCSGLKSIVVDSNNPVYDSRENCNSIIESASNTLISGCMNSKIPNSVTSIGEYAFYGCDGLTEVTIPESVTSIGNSAFYDCDGLTEVTIPESVTSIGNSAFYDCDGLTEVTIPESVTSIGEEAFYGCNGLTEVTFNATNCIYMGNFYINWRDEVRGSVFGNCNKFTQLTFGNKVQIIPKCGFNNCTKLTSITIPNSVTSIGGSAFKDCTGLTSITIPNSVTSIGGSAFKDCTGLTEITIPNSVTSIGEEAFKDCTGLTKITIPESVTSIGEEAFYNSIIGPTRGYHIQPPKYASIITTITRFDNWNCNKQFYINCYGEEYELNGEEITIDGLTPGRDYNIYIYIEINGCKTKLTDFEYTTKDINISVQTSKTATSILVTPNIKSGDAVVANQYVSDGSNIFPTYITGLDPNTTYTFNYVVEGESWTRKKEFTVKTDELTMLTLPGQAMNTTTALLCAETNICDDEVNVGFEWRRHDAPSTLPSNKVVCAAIDGTITGALSGLNPEVYYNYRPYYTSNSGKTYYGEWITFFTGDANVFFDPTVKTYSAEVLDNYSAVLKGYALRGSEEIASQGFQYWKSWGAPNGSRSNEVVEVEVNGQKLSCTISDLEPGSTYTYRTFVKTASGITYGEEMTFDTPGSAGIEETIAETTEVVITGYYNLQGVKSDRPFSGLNIVSYSDGTTKKVIYRK